MKFKILKIKQNGEILSYNDYYLTSVIEDCNVIQKDICGNTVVRRNPNCGSIFSKQKFANSIKNKSDALYGLTQSPAWDGFEEHFNFKAKEVVEFEFY